MEKIECYMATRRNNNLSKKRKDFSLQSRYFSIVKHHQVESLYASNSNTCCWYHEVEVLQNFSCTNRNEHADAKRDKQTDDLLRSRQA